MSALPSYFLYRKTKKALSSVATWSPCGKELRPQVWSFYENLFSSSSPVATPRSSGNLSLQLTLSNPLWLNSSCRVFYLLFLPNSKFCPTTFCHCPQTVCVRRNDSQPVCESAFRMQIFVLKIFIRVFAGLFSARMYLLNDLVVLLVSLVALSLGETSNEENDSHRREKRSNIPCGTAFTPCQRRTPGIIEPFVNSESRDAPDPSQFVTAPNIRHQMLGLAIVEAKDDVDRLFNQSEPFIRTTSELLWCFLLSAYFHLLSCRSGSEL